MKQRLFTPGPTAVPEDTLLELARPVFYHRSATFRALLQKVTEDLQYVFCTKNPVLTLTASGTGAMEAALVNTLAPGDKAIALIAGRWGERWKNICKAFGFELVNVSVPYGEVVAPAQLERALAQHPDAKVVRATLCETATGVKGDIAAYGKIVAGGKAVFVVDAISGLGCVECRTDDWHVDVNVAGSQKALMLPPGLAFLSVSDKAWAVIEGNAGLKAFYFDLRKYRDNLKTGDTPYTPANTLVRALKVSLEKLRTEGIENVWARYAHGRRGWRAGIQALDLELFATVPAEGMTVARVPPGIDGKTLLTKLEKQYGVKLADGQDTLKGKIIRLGHMGYVDLLDVLGALGALELVLLEMGHPVEPGAAVAAAQRVFAEVVGAPQTLGA